MRINRLLTPIASAITLGITLAGASVGWAQVPYEFLNRSERPTMAETAGVAHLIVDEPGVPVALRHHQMDVWLDLVIQHAPRMIAAMEKTFPGATWVFLGRDSLLWADVVEAFYLSIGQRDRVVRIGVSKATFHDQMGNSVASPDQLYALLETHGLDIEEVKRGRGYVFVDTISQGYGRQGRALLGTIYSRFQKEEGDAFRLLRRVNIFGLTVSTFSGTRYPWYHAEEFFSEEENRYQTKRIADFNKHHHILTYDEPDSTKQVNEAGYEHWTGAWNGSFGVLQRDASGATRAVPGPLNHELYRKTILWTQKRLLERTAKREFLERVKSEASQIGYEFPMKRPRLPALQEVVKEEPADPKAELKRKLAEVDEEITRNKVPAAARAELLRMLQGMEKAERVDGRLSSNGDEILRWYRAYRAVVTSPSALGLLMVKVLREAREEHKTRTHDLQVILGEVMADSKPSVALAREIQEFSKESRGVKSLIRSRKDWMSAEAQEVYEVLDQVIRGECGRLLEEK